MYYIKIQFTLGLECEAYQEVDDNGRLVRILDSTGSEIVLDEVGAAFESHVVEENVTPPWL